MIRRQDLEKGDALATPMHDATPFSFTIETHRQIIPVDEPFESGGNDHGMNPYDLLASSLSSCTAMTLRYYAHHKGIELGFFQVKVGITKRIDPETGKTVHVFTRELYFDEMLTPEQQEKYKEIASKCPVHRALTGEVQIATTVNVKR
jgi:putative redox protein